MKISKNYYQFLKNLSESITQTSKEIKKIQHKLYEKNYAYISLNKNIESDIVQAYNSEQRFKCLLYDIKSAMMCKLMHNNACSNSVLPGHFNVDCSIVENARKNGLVLLGQTNSDEFCCGSYGIHSNYNHAILNDGTTPGGSSSGAAVSAKYLSHISVGTDTGGSCRFPAIMSNVIGLKTTFGSISRHLVFDYANSLDTISFMTSEVDNLDIAMQIWCGKDKQDSCTIDFEYKVYTETNDKIIITIIEYDQMSKTQKQFIDKISKIFNVKISNIQIDHKVISTTYENISSIEFFSNTNKFEEIKYRHKIKRHKLEYSNYLQRYQHFSNNTVNKLFYGSVLLGTEEYRDIYYQSWQKRSNISYTINSSFCDSSHVFLMPGLHKEQDIQESYLYIANITGCPSIAFNISDDIYDSINIMGKMKSDNVLIHICKQIKDLIKTNE